MPTVIWHESVVQESPPAIVRAIVPHSGIPASSGGIPEIFLSFMLTSQRWVCGQEWSRVKVLRERAGRSGGWGASVEKEPRRSLAYEEKNTLQIRFVQSFSGVRPSPTRKKFNSYMIPWWNWGICITNTFGCLVYMSSFLGEGKLALTEGSVTVCSLVPEEVLSRSLGFSLYVQAPSSLQVWRKHEAHTFSP